MCRPFGRVHGRWPQRALPYRLQAEKSVWLSKMRPVEGVSIMLGRAPNGALPNF
jgi:hypothetical protein